MRLGPRVKISGFQENPDHAETVVRRQINRPASIENIDGLQ